MCIALKISATFARGELIKEKGEMTSSVTESQINV